MKKLLILSDSHGRVGGLLDAVERERPDAAAHLGDLSRDAQDLAAACPDLPRWSVAGNCDGWGAAAPDELEVTLEGVRFLFTHGHRYRVKLGPGLLLQAGRERQIDCLCYGHTHEPVAQLQPDGRWLVNPGTAGGVGNRATYGVVRIGDGQVLSAEIKEL